MLLKSMESWKYITNKKHMTTSLCDNFVVRWLLHTMVGGELLWFSALLIVWVLINISKLTSFSYTPELFSLRLYVKPSNYFQIFVVCTKGKIGLSFSSFFLLVPHWRQTSLSLSWMSLQEQQCSLTFGITGTRNMVKWFYFTTELWFKKRLPAENWTRKRAIICIHVISTKE